MKRLSLIAGCLLLSWNAYAAEVEGVRLPDTLHVGQRDLVLNGAGVRSMFFFHTYVAALYLKEKSTSSDSILSADIENRLELHMLRDVSSEALSKSFNKTIRLNLTPAEMAALDSQLKQLDTLFS
ncbi:MAG: chalcone isomerase family protein, partial [Sideroxydans sp.]|nr:chalcone isomerase family protein [Sideroxyarcus sp.]